MGHNSAIVGSTESWLRPLCSSHDSASDEISVMDMAAVAVNPKFISPKMKPSCLSLHKQ